MLVAERRQVILERLHAASRVVVADLSAEFGVSEETIRRDLEWLEKEGVATRTYGGAVLKNNDRVPPPYAVRKNTNVEGKVAILVDNSPSALILPTSIYDMIEEANDYYFPTLTRVYLKAARALINFLTIFLTPVFLLFMQNLNWLPEIFAFVAVKDTVNIPLIFQLLMLEIAIDGLRLAALNTPSMLSTPLSVIAGLVMGEFSVKSGWFNSEVMLYMAFVAVANYTQPNFELGYALKFMRLQLLVLTALFNWVGFAAGCGIVVMSICFNRTLSGRSYLDVRLN